MMYRTGLVPRRVAWLGLIGGPLIIISGTAVLFGGDHGAGSLQGIATLPEAAWELFLGVYCTVWGFRRDAPILASSASIASGGGA
jgi:peptidoglycan/LPS O-acetylase OafA/YrhL